MAPRPVSIASVFAQPKMAALLFLGFSSGIPLFLVSQTLQAWMAAVDVDLTTIGMVSLISLPYTLKFLWAPVLDRYIPPFLGRRRGWILIAQVALLVAIGAMGFHDPKAGLRLLAFNAILVAFFSATQDVAVDAYSVDVVEDDELGAGASLKILGYRIALLITGGVALTMADYMAWSSVYLAMAGLMAIGIVATVLAPEPVLRDVAPVSIKAAIADSFTDFFRRTGPGLGVVLLIFTLCYQLPDRFAGNMATPFLVKIGFSMTEIGVVKGGIGLAATLVGVIAAGPLISRWGVNRSLWVFGALQVLSNLAYYWLANVGPERGALLVTMVVENVAQGMVAAVFVAFMMSLCTRQFSATQFALLSSVMSFARDLLVARAGAIADATGWSTFFLLTLAAGIPAAVLLPFVAPWSGRVPRGAAAHSGVVTDAPGPVDSDRT